MLQIVTKALVFLGPMAHAWWDLLCYSRFMNFLLASLYFNFFPNKKGIRRKKSNAYLVYLSTEK